MRTQPVSDDDVLRFREDGVVALRDVVSAAWIERLTRAIEADIAEPGPFYHGYEPEDGRGRFHGNLRTWEHHEDFRAFCMESTMPELARRLLGAGRINLLYDQLFVKEPGTVNRTRWHNDQPYWPIAGDQVLSIWVALDVTTAANGALEFVRGSHRWGRLFQPEVFGRNALEPYERNPDYEPIPDIEAARADYEILSFDLEPGDVYVFHGLTVHGAGGNATRDVRRRGYAVRYTGDDVTYSGHPGTNRGLRHPELADGDPLDSAQYPVVLSDSTGARCC